MRSCFLVFALLLLAGCQRPVVVYDVPGSRSYDAASADLWPRLVEALEAKGLTITESSHASGRLVAVKRSNDALRDLGIRACDRADGLVQGPLIIAAPLNDAPGPSTRQILVGVGTKL